MELWLFVSAKADEAAAAAAAAPRLPQRLHHH